MKGAAAASSAGWDLSQDGTVTREMWREQGHTMGAKRSSREGSSGRIIRGWAPRQVSVSWAEGREQGATNCVSQVNFEGIKLRFS